MMEILIRFVSLGLFAAISLNLLVQMGIGIDVLGEDEGLIHFYGILRRACVFFVASLVLWCLYVYILMPLSLSFLAILLLFPLSALLSLCLNRLYALILKQKEEKEEIHKTCASNALIVATVFVTSHMALSFVEALVMIVGFVLGYVLSSLIIRAVALRTDIEQVPPSMRAAPVILISEGLLALIFSALSGVILHSMGI